MIDVWIMKVGVLVGLKMELIVFVNWVIKKGSLCYKWLVDEDMNIVEIIVFRVEFVFRDRDEGFIFYFFVYG